MDIEALPNIARAKGLFIAVRHGVGPSPQLVWKIAAKKPASPSLCDTSSLVVMKSKNRGQNRCYLFEDSCSIRASVCVGVLSFEVPPSLPSCIGDKRG